MNLIHKFVLLSVCLASTAFAQPSVKNWYLPLEINDLNTQVRFEVDSTWHLVKGSTGNVSGEAHLADENDPRSISASLSIPVASFDTDNSSRDEELRGVMFAEKYPAVVFSATKLKGDCTPALVLRDGKCEDSLIGELQIAAKKESIELPITILRTEGDRFRVEGKFPLRWADYGVEDPSIFIARLKPVVTIFFSVDLAPSQQEG